MTGEGKDLTVTIGKDVERTWQCLLVIFPSDLKRRRTSGPEQNGTDIIGIYACHAMPCQSYLRTSCATRFGSTSLLHVLSAARR